MSKSVTAEPVSGDVVFIPLTKLKKSPRNARTTPHPEADIEALATSISAKGLLQNLVVEPERHEDGTLTGHYLVTIGEGRRLAHRLLAKRKLIAKNAPVRCVIDTEHSAQEISLAENVLRTPMHPADQYEAFAKLHNEQGMNADDIAARFGVTPAVVRQRLKLAAVSPAMLARYRADELNLEALTAFAITDDHVLQERVWNALPEWERESRHTILQALTQTEVPSSDRRAIFIGAEAYEAAGGRVIRDLFGEDGEGYFNDPDLLNRLVEEKLQPYYEQAAAEGWKWVTLEVAHYEIRGTLRRVYPEQRKLNDEQQQKVIELECELEALSDADELNDEEYAEFQRLNAAIDELYGDDVYSPEAYAKAGAFVSLDRNGEPVIERGFVRPEDQAMQKATGSKPKANGHGALPEKLTMELAAYRTAALRNELAMRPDLALVAVTHALATRYFYHTARSCLDIVARSQSLTVHASAIRDNIASKEIDARHDEWARQLPEDEKELWAHIAAMDQASCLSLLAHCAALAVNALPDPRQTTLHQLTHADQLAYALDLDMTRYWQPSVAHYLGRVPKPRILEAVREGVSAEAADNIASMKKPAMAEAAAQRLEGKGWLPSALRAPSLAEAAQ